MVYCIKIECAIKNHRANCAKNCIVVLRWLKVKTYEQDS